MAPFGTPAGCLPLGQGHFFGSGPHMQAGEGGLLAHTQTHSFIKQVKPPSCGAPVFGHSAKHGVSFTVPQATEDGIVAPIYKSQRTQLQRA